MDSNKLDDFIKEYSSYSLKNKDSILSRSQTNEALLFSFFEMFGIEKLSNMKIDDYCFEKGNKNSFCYWFDYQLNDLCDIHIRHTSAFQKYHIQKIGNEYKFLKKNQKRNKFGSNPQEVFENVRNEIINVARASQRLGSDNIDIIKNSGLHESFKAKLTYVYGSDNWIPILAKSDVDKILEWFGVDYKKADNLTDKRIRLFSIYKEILNKGISITSWKFMDFIYNESGLRSSLRPNNKVVSTNALSQKRKKSANKKQNTIVPNTGDITITSPASIVCSGNSYSESDDISTEADFEKLERIKKRIGKEGELIVLNYLEKNKNHTNIEKPCIEGKNNLHYDFSYVENGIRHYIEVKSTSSASGETIYFEMSNQEYLFMTNHLKDGVYEIFYVRNVFGTPTISIIKPELIVDKLETKSYFLKGKI